MNRLGLLNISIPRRSEHHKHKYVWRRLCRKRLAAINNKRGQTNYNYSGSGAASQDPHKED
jgi:hypothetical protein